MIRRRLGAAIVATVALAVATPSLPVRAAEGGGWIGTWAASPQPVWEPDFLAPIPFPRNLWNQTIRQVARVSLGGDQVRIVVSNKYGSEPLVVSEAHIAVSDGGAKIKDGTDRKLTFSGNDSIAIPPGAPAISDPVDLEIAPLGSVAVSLYFAGVAPTTTMHNDGRQTAYIVAGNKTADVDMSKDAVTTLSRIFLTDILVNAAEGARAIVTFGDSITDGDGSSADANKRWPDVLAERLQAAGGTPTAVLNQGISGERVLTDRMGVNALAHFDQAVLTPSLCRHRHFHDGHQRYRLARFRPRSACRRADCRRDHRRLRAAHCPSA